MSRAKSEDGADWYLLLEEERRAMVYVPLSSRYNLVSEHTYDTTTSGWNGLDI